MDEDEALKWVQEYVGDAARDIFQKVILVFGGVLMTLALAVLASEIQPLLEVNIGFTQPELLAGTVLVGMGAGSYWGKIMSLKALRPDFFYGGIFSTLFYFSWVSLPDLAIIPGLLSAGIITLHMSRAVDSEMSGLGSFFEKTSKAGVVLLGLWVFVLPVVAEFFPFITGYIPGL